MSKKLGETSYKSTAFGVIPRSRLIELEVEGTKLMWDDAIAHAIPIRIDIAFILHLHSVGFKWIFPDFGGKIRTIDVQVSHHQPPKFFLVRGLLEDYCRDLDVRVRNIAPFDNESSLESLIEFLAWAHHRFVWIHPFQDYNGRLARIMMNVVLLNLNLPPFELPIETPIRRRKYIKALAAADAGDLGPLQKIFQQGLAEVAKKL